MLVRPCVSWEGDSSVELPAAIDQFVAARGSDVAHLVLFRPEVCATEWVMANPRLRENTTLASDWFMFLSINVCTDPGEGLAHFQTFYQVIITGQGRRS